MHDHPEIGYAICYGKGKPESQRELQHRNATLIAIRVRLSDAEAVFAEEEARLLGRVPA